ncbi:uncharacterized protein LOC124450454 [Xenia sp. Carnegie-2017]|uniref:uncharacterized protein LOC124450454 n=1 Tax=Xenia sp. Carnegie-2017 TaxID=2897299 RepID=UPI001F03692D|nr:uncharacterized protein LOC124450454 [Xenia sp. Carnegie-2017]
MRSVEFGVLLKERGRNRKPYRISSMEKDCRSTSALSVAQNQCNGKKKCSFTVRKEDFLSRPSSCRETSTLLVYYTCKTPRSMIRTTQAMQIITSSKSDTISKAPSKKATTEDHETVFKKENKCSTSTKNNLYLVAGVAIGAVPFIVLIVVFLIWRMRQKRNLGNMYTERVLYKKRTKDEKRLTVSIDEECVKEDFKTNQNVVTKSSKKLQSKSKPQASH